MLLQHLARAQGRAALASLTWCSVPRLAPRVLPRIAPLAFFHHSALRAFASPPQDPQQRKEFEESIERGLRDAKKGNRDGVPDEVRGFFDEGRRNSKKADEQSSEDKEASEGNKGAPRRPQRPDPGSPNEMLSLIHI